MGLSASLTPQSVAAVDSLGIADEILAQPSQLDDALWRTDAAGIAARDLAGGVAFCGVGGSAIGGDIAQAVIGRRARSQIRTVRDYSPGQPLDERTLVVCASYSGETEETLACFEAADAAGAPRVVVTTGGRLAASARSAGVPVIGVPAGLKPRSAIVYMTVAAMQCAALAGAAPALEGEIASAADLLRRLAAEWGPQASEDSRAKTLARRLEGTIPVIYGAELTVPVARRWKAQINENAKLPAFYSALPEANHNELCGWEETSTVSSLFAVFLTDRDTHPRVLQRIDLSAAHTASVGAGAETIETVGETPTERALSAVMLGDLVSFYLAVLGGTDPGPIEPVERLKRALD